MRMLQKLLKVLRIENNLIKMAYLMFALRFFYVSVFLEAV